MAVKTSIILQYYCNNSTVRVYLQLQTLLHALVKTTADYYL